MFPRRYIGARYFPVRYIGSHKLGYYLMFLCI